MNSREREKPVKRAKPENTHSVLPLQTRGLFPSQEKQDEIRLFQKFCTLKTSLESAKLNLNLLHAAHLTQVKDVIEILDFTTDHLKQRRIKSPALKYLKMIIQDLHTIILKDRCHIRQYLEKSLQDNPAHNNNYVIMLADIFLNFKRRIDATGLLSDQAVIFDEDPDSLSAVKRDCNWITYFHCVIQPALDKMQDTEINDAFSTFTDTVNLLQDLTYQSLQKNFPWMTDKYSELEYKQPFSGTDPAAYFDQLQQNDAGAEPTAKRLKQ